jgi:hypothetical protein
MAEHRDIAGPGHARPAAQRERCRSVSPRPAAARRIVTAMSS